MRGRVHRSDITVERVVIYKTVNLISPPEEHVEWTASFDAPLWTEEGVAVENLNLSFTGQTYDGALNKLLAEFEALEIEVVLGAKHR